MAWTPRLDILPPAQQRVWRELSSVSTEFTLYGGTAVALHLGHRASVDFDFFAATHIVTDALYRDTAVLAGSTIVQQAPDTLTCIAERGGPVKLSFFGLPHLARIEEPHVVAENGLRVAALIDLAGTKAAVVQQRAEAKDYVDLDAIICAGVSLPMALAAAKMIYGAGFNPLITLKALSYFGDGDLPTLPPAVQQHLTAAASAVDLNFLPPVRPGTGGADTKNGAAP